MLVKIAAIKAEESALDAIVKEHFNKVKVLKEAQVEELSKFYKTAARNFSRLALPIGVGVGFSTGGIGFGGSYMLLKALGYGIGSLNTKSVLGRLLLQGVPKATEAVLKRTLAVMPKVSTFTGLSLKDSNEIANNLERKDEKLLEAAIRKGLGFKKVSSKIIDNVVSRDVNSLKLLKKTFKQDMNPAERYAASKVLASVENVRVIIEHIKKGQLSREDVIVLKDVYPRVYEVMEEFARKNYKNIKDPIKKRLLGMILGLNNKTTIQSLIYSDNSIKQTNANASNQMTQMQSIQNGPGGTK